MVEIVLYAVIFLIGYWVGREMAFRKAERMLREAIENGLWRHDG